MCEFTHPTSLRDQPLNPNLLTGINGISSMGNQYKMFQSNNSNDETYKDNKEGYNYRYPEVNLNISNFKGINGIGAYDKYKNEKKQNETFITHKPSMNKQTDNEDFRLFNKPKNLFKYNKMIDKLYKYYNNIDSLMVIATALQNYGANDISKLKQGINNILHNIDNPNISENDLIEFMEAHLNKINETYINVISTFVNYINSLGGFDKAIEYYYNNNIPYVSQLIASRYVLQDNKFINKFIKDKKYSIQYENFDCGCPFQYTD